MKILVKIVAWSIVLCYFAKKYTRQAARYIKYEAFKARKNSRFVKLCYANRIDPDWTSADRFKESITTYSTSPVTAGVQGSLGGYIALAGHAQAQQAALMAQQAAAQQQGEFNLLQAEYEQQRMSGLGQHKPTIGQYAAMGQAYRLNALYGQAFHNPQLSILK